MPEAIFAQYIKIIFERSEPRGFSFRESRMETVINSLSYMVLDHRSE